MYNENVKFYRFNPNCESYFTIVTDDQKKEQYKEMMEYYESIVIAEKLANVEDQTVIIPENLDYDNWILILTYGDYGIQFEKRRYEPGLKIFIQAKVKFSHRIMYSKLEGFEQVACKTIFNRLKGTSESMGKDIVLKDVNITKDYDFISSSTSYRFMLEFEAYPYFEYKEIRTIRENYFDYIYKEFKFMIEKFAEGDIV